MKIEIMVAHPSVMCYLCQEFFRFFRENGDDFKEVADDSVVAHFEDIRFGIFIDGDDGA